MEKRSFWKKVLLFLVKKNKRTASENQKQFFCVGQIYVEQKQKTASVPHNFAKSVFRENRTLWGFYYSSLKLFYYLFKKQLVNHDYVLKSRRNKKATLKMRETDLI